MASQNSAPVILVTGASGFLGGKIAEQLGSVNCRLRTTGRRMSPPSDLPNYTALELSDETGFSRLSEGVDVVIHAAGLAHQHHAAPSQTGAFVRINSAGTGVAARAAAAAGCQRFVLVSSVAVYGSGWPPKTEAARCSPACPYAQSKLEAERIAAEIAGSAGMELIILRMATLYGENDPGNVGRVLKAVDRGRFLWVGRGENCKSLVHVEDAASACVIAACHSGRLISTIYNVAAEPCDMNAIVATLATALERKTPSVYFPAAPLRMAATLATYIPALSRRAQHLRSTLEKWLSHDVYDATLFRHSFGWQPRVSLAGGLSRQVARYRETQNRLMSSDCAAMGFEHAANSASAA